jgi:hypothetical protein
MKRKKRAPSDPQHASDDAPDTAAPSTEQKLIYDPMTDSYYGGRELTWRGTTWEAIAYRLRERAAATEAQALQHDKYATRWRRIVAPFAWLTAALAALSGLSIVSTNETAALAFSIATALVAATNAAVDPAGTERAHRAAALAYDRLRRKLDDFAYFNVQDYELVLPADEVKKMRDQIGEFDEAFRQIADAAPGARVDLRPRAYRHNRPEEQRVIPA